MRVFPRQLEPPGRFCRRALVAVVLGGIGVVAMGCADEQVASVHLDVVFPSTAMAIASDDVKFVVYDDPTPGACQRIYLKHITNQTDLPPVVLDPPAVAVCDLAFGRSAPLVLHVGKHSVLAVASRDNEDLLVGCSDVAVSAEGGVVVVNLALPGATPVPPSSSCLSLRDVCENRCP